MKGGAVMKEMDYGEALDYIHGLYWRGKKNGLEKTKELLDLTGHPERELSFVHIAGTNGKGSTAVMLASILEAAGYKTGLYTSPYIMRYNERIQVNREEIPDVRLAGLTSYLSEYVGQMEVPPSEFEFGTVLAFLYFKEMHCDIVVLETGLGGRFDSTNVIECPKACVITALGYDHTSILGTTMAEIADAKAGIIKAGSRVVFYGEEPEGEAVIRKRCRELRVPLVLPEFSKLRAEDAKLWQPGKAAEVQEKPKKGKEWQSVQYMLPKQRFSYKHREGLELSLPGEYQQKNAAVVLETIDVLKEGGVHISEDAVREGLSGVFWQARLEVLSEKPLMLVDGSHNPQGMRATMGSLQKLFPDRRFTFVFGAMADKALEEMTEIFLPLAKKVLVTAPSLPRAKKPEELLALCEHIALERDLCCVFSCCPSAAEAVSMAKNEPAEEVVVIIGSLYLAGEVKNTLVQGYQPCN